jgi:hypothetical protein
MTPDLITRARAAMDLEPRASRRALWGEMIAALEQTRLERDVAREIATNNLRRAERAALVRVKPLVWEPVDEICTRFVAPALGGKMIVVELDPGTGDYSAGFDLGGLSFRLIQAQYSDQFDTWSAPAKYPSIEAAKAAAQADYEARIKSALETPND